MEFTKDPIFEEESKVSAKRALYKDVHRLLVEVPGYDTYSQQFWSDANRFILKVSDMNTPQLGHLYPMISRAASPMNRYDSEMYERSYKVRWEVDEFGKPVVRTTKVSLRDTPLLETAYCVHLKYLNDQFNLVLK